jgi:hypothetical protein
MFQTKIIDNFYEDPILVRNFALQQFFYKREGHYPGLRSDLISDIDYEFYLHFTKKLVNVYYDTNVTDVSWQNVTLFQWADKKHEKGWVHADYSKDHSKVNAPEADWDVAGVVYLTPDAPKNCGTSIYKPIVDNLKPFPENYTTDPFKIGKTRDAEYILAQNQHNSQFKKIQCIENVFNRLVVYDCQQWHAQDGFFGNNKFDSRLTQVFFAKLKKI